jgi:UDP-2,3-diacylglucosamine hydrolase
MPDGAAYFLSDAHLGTDPAPLEAARTQRLHDFLSNLKGKADTLFIVGDLFDFWFEYRTAIPRRYFATLCVLEELRRAGVKIVYLAGNHDFWLGHFLHDELGIETLEGPLSLSLQGRHLWLHHGDGLLGDAGYSLLRRVVRSPVSIALYGLIHPDLGFPLAHWVSRLSRHSREGRTLNSERLLREVAAPRFAEGYDAVLIGHFHHAYEHRANGRELFVLGDWFERFTYLVLENGRFRLEAWPAPER